MGYVRFYNGLNYLGEVSFFGDASDQQNGEQYIALGAAFSAVNQVYFSVWSYIRMVIVD